MHDLLDCKKSLMDSYQSITRKRADDEYNEGVKAGLEMAMMEIERMIEEASRKQATYYGQE